MTRTPEGRDRLLRLVVIGNPGRPSGGVAQLQMNDACTCPMLETDHRCGVQSTFGEEALTTSCSVFPRTALAVDDQVEVNGSLGCPEVARLTLLSDGDLHLRPAARPLLPRAYIGNTVSPEPDDAYAHHFRSVREALLACFRLPRLTLGTQFVLAADLAERTRAFFHSGTVEFQGARSAFTEQRLRAELAETTSPRVHAALNDDLAALNASGEAVITVVTSLLSGRRGLAHSPRFGTLVDSVFESMRAENAEDAAAPGKQTGAEQLWRVYARRRSALDLRLGQPLTGWFSKYCQHFLLRNPYVDAANLLGYLYGLGVQLAAIRFLVLGHPDLADLAGRSGTTAQLSMDRLTAERLVVHVVQTFTKAVSHHPDFLRAGGVSGATSAPPVTFGRLVLLAKFL